MFWKTSRACQAWRFFPSSTNYGRGELRRAEPGETPLVFRYQLSGDDISLVAPGAGCAQKLTIVKDDSDMMFFKHSAQGKYSIGGSWFFTRKACDSRKSDDSPAPSGCVSALAEVTTKGGASPYITWPLISAGEALGAAAFAGKSIYWPVRVGRSVKCQRWKLVPGKHAAPRGTLARQPANAGAVVLDYEVRGSKLYLSVPGEIGQCRQELSLAPLDGRDELRFANGGAWYFEPRGCTSHKKAVAPRGCATALATTAPAKAIRQGRLSRLIRKGGLIHVLRGDRCQAWRFDPRHKVLWSGRRRADSTEYTYDFSGDRIDLGGPSSQSRYGTIGIGRLVTLPVTHTAGDYVLAGREPWFLRRAACARVRRLAQPAPPSPARGASPQ